MKLTKNKLIALILGLIIVVSLSAFVITTKVSNVAFADTSTNDATKDVSETNSDEFVVLDSQNIVPATYTFTKLNDKECSVRISNKTTATTAVIPAYGEINNQKYKVTEIATNGFMASTKLVRVSLPITMKKIGNMAFANCSQLTRINLSNVEIIGNSAFYRCSELRSIIIPESVNSMGSNVFNYNNTKVKLRAEAIDDEWTSTWNTNNNNDIIELNCQDIQPLELETDYNVSVRSGTPAVSLRLAGGQPRTDNFYLTQQNRDDYTEKVGNNIFIPKAFKGISIDAISGDAFAGAFFDQLIVEYSSTPIKIGDMSFFAANKNYEIENEITDSKIIINREVVFLDVQSKAESNNIFTDANVKAIVLPDNITIIPECTFYSCTNLENIYFRTPEDIADRDKMLGIISKAEEENINAINQDESIDLTQLGHSSVVYLPKSIESIGSDAFSLDTNIKILNIYENVSKVGSRIVSDWNNDGTQLVKVHNTKKIEYGKEKWAEDWAAEFSNYKFDKEIYTIHFDDTFGNITTMDVEYNKEIGELPLLDLDTHKFKGWLNEKTNELFNGNTLPEKKDLYLKALLSVYYFIDLKSEDGETTYCTIKGTKGDRLPSINMNDDNTKIPKELGYVIKGFYSKDGTNRYFAKADGEDLLIGFNPWDKESDGEIFAKKELKEYTINYHATDLVGQVNDNRKTFTIVDVNNNTFQFTPIIGTGSKSGEKVIWSLNSIKEAIKFDLIENEIINVDGTWVVLKAAITYEGLGHGINNSQNKSTLSYGEEFELKNPTKSGYVFNGWRIGGQYVQKVSYANAVITNSTYDIITINAAFSTRLNTGVSKLDRNVSFIALDGKDAFIVELPDNFPQYHVLRIEIYPQVKQVHIYSKSYKEYGIYIVVHNRTTDLDLHLENVKMIAPNMEGSYNDFKALSVVSMSTTNNSALNLYSYGHVEMYGSSGYDQLYNKPAKDGNYAINCSVLNFKRAERLYLYGGDGGIGNPGGRGAVAVHANIITNQNLAILKDGKGNGLLT